MSDESRDAVPLGVAPQSPPPPKGHDKDVQDKLERMIGTGPDGRGTKDGGVDE